MLTVIRFRTKQRVLQAEHYNASNEYKLWTNNKVDLRLHFTKYIIINSFHLADDII